jgi:hypothetical protein
MLRKFVLLAIRSSVAYRLSQSAGTRGIPPAGVPGVMPDAQLHA